MLQVLNFCLKYGGSVAAYVVDMTVNVLTLTSYV